MKNKKRKGNEEKKRKDELDERIDRKGVMSKEPTKKWDIFVNEILEWEENCLRWNKNGLVLALRDSR